MRNVDSDPPNPSLTTPDREPREEVPRRLDVWYRDPRTPEWLASSQSNRKWGLTGPGYIEIGPQSVVLRGRRNRLFRRSVPNVVSLARPDLCNVLSAGRVVQCQVRHSLGVSTPLTFWLPDAAAADTLVRLLPTERTAEFEQEVADRWAFDVALQQVGTKTVVTKTLIAINVFTFLVVAAAGGGVLVPDSVAMMRFGANAGPLTVTGEWWRLGTATFLHFGLVHLLVNMWALWAMGRVTERLFGSGYFLLLTSSPACLGVW